MPTSSPIVQVSGLSKSFGAFQAVNDLSFSVMEGDVYGFLGQNGAGKSTTIRMLLSLVRPTSGRILIHGMDMEKHRREILSRVGAVIESPDLYTYLSGYENLEIFARLSGVKPDKKRLMEKLDLVGLASRGQDKVRAYSQGMKQRLGIAVAMVHDPSLVILDEPTNGLDPQGIADIRNLIRSLSRDQGKTVIVSSHLLAEIEQVATRLLIIDKGRKIVEGPLQELLDPDHVSLEVDTSDNDACMRFLSGSEWGSALERTTSGRIKMTIKADQVAALNRALVVHDIEVRALDPQNALEAYFLSLTQPPAHVEPGQD